MVDIKNFFLNYMNKYFEILKYKYLIIYKIKKDIS